MSLIPVCISFQVNSSHAVVVGCMFHFGCGSLCRPCSFYICVGSAFWWHRASGKYHLCDHSPMVRSWEGPRTNTHHVIPGLSHRTGCMDSLKHLGLHAMASPSSFNAYEQQRWESRLRHQNPPHNWKREFVFSHIRQ